MANRIMQLKNINTQLKFENTLSQIYALEKAPIVIPASNAINRVATDLPTFLPFATSTTHANMEGVLIPEASPQIIADI